jgi:hypothetical protein
MILGGGGSGDGDGDGDRGSSSDDENDKTFKTAEIVREVADDGNRR